jgi:hypothetical protein
MMSWIAGGMAWCPIRADMRCWYWRFSAVPSTATPSAPPTCSDVSLVADPTPASSLGTDPMTESVEGAMARPTPHPMIRKNGRHQRKPSPIVVWDRNPRPSAIRSSPGTTTDLVPILWASTAEKGAVTSSTSATGATASPAWKALRPRTNCRYWVMRNSRPIRAKSTSASEAMAAE